MFHNEQVWLHLVSDMKLEEYDMINIMADILHEKELLISRLDKLLYGAVELREQKENKYIYVHYREEGIQKNKIRRWI